MCEQCEAATVYYSKNEDADKFLGHWSLIRATKDGMFMENGDWGLLECNDPDFTFTDTPWASPWAYSTEAELDALEGAEAKEHDRWIYAKCKFARDFYDSGAFHKMTRLILVCQKSGWVHSEKTDHSEKNDLAAWLFQKLGEYMFAHPHPITETVQETTEKE